MPQLELPTKKVLRHVEALTYKIYGHWIRPILLGGGHLATIDHTLIREWHRLLSEIHSLDAYDPDHTPTHEWTEDDRCIVIVRVRREMLRFLDTGHPNIPISQAQDWIGRIQMVACIYYSADRLEWSRAQLLGTKETIH